MKNELHKIAKNFWKLCKQYDFSEVKLGSNFISSKFLVKFEGVSHFLF